MLYLVWFMVFNATFNNISVFLYYVRFQKNIKHFFFYISTSVDTEMCCPKGKCGCQYFILLTLKKKKIHVQRGPGFF
jgi:hypothetical protein